ncbi:uncharacterized protein LOC115690741 [Syzygium oleosum]|uniref:uncharacterized protein LOC115690741 n=1 Tax=Syzygium oleosum TaxID=219896 RepID=UPI0024B912E6|nr:uncharacterized protein LOC115690741 [Syzygium oleosum]
MAFHQNLASKDPRPPTVTQASATGQTQDGFISSPVHTAVNPQLAPVLNPQQVPNPGFGGGTVYANAAHGGAEWHSSVPAPHGYARANPSAAVGYPHIVSNVGANGIDKSGNEVAPGFGYGPYVGHRIVGNTVGRAGAQNANRNGSGQNFVTIDRRNDEEQFSSDSGVGHKPHLSDQGSGSGAGRLIDKVGEDLVLGKTVKLLCKFGGELLRSPDCGVLKYARGEMKIVRIRGDVSFSEFVQKMVDTCGQQVVVKYQLPDHDLDALISVTSHDDLDHMMNECERLDSGLSDGSAKLKVFLFPDPKLDSSSAIRIGDLHSSGQRNLEAMNGTMDGMGGGTTRKESTASTTSSQNSDISSNEAFDRTVPVQADIDGPPLTSTRSPGGNLAASNDASSLQLEIEQERTAPKRPLANNLQQAGGGIPSASPYIRSYMDPHKENVNIDHLPPPHMMDRPSPHPLGTAGPAYAQQQFHENAGGGNSQQLISAVDRTTDMASSQAGLRPTVVPPFTHPQQNQSGEEATSGKRLVPLPSEKHHDAYRVQAPSAMVGDANGSQVQPGQAVYCDGSAFCCKAENIQRFETRAFCQKALPDAFSNIVVLDKRDTTVSHLPVSSSIHHCLPLEDNIKTVPRMNDPDSMKHMVGFAGNGQSPFGVLQGLVPEPFLEIGTQQHFMPAQCQLKQEALASKLVISDSSPVRGSAEHIIEQELQNVLEGVVACAFQTVLPSYPDLTVYEGNKPTHEFDQEKDEHHKADSEDVSAMLAGRVHFRFPVSDAIGGLQIIKSCDLEVKQELGSGTYGTVHHGKWRGKDVAIKRINNRCFLGEPLEQERMMHDFLNEAKLLADLHHPNVVAFYGIVHDWPDGPGDSVLTVTEYMVDGSLRKALQKGERNFDMRKRLLIAREVAFGMEYLHDKKIVHFDLKSDNLLVNLGDPRQPTCKIGDLGLSKVKQRTLIAGGMRGTIPWMAPELLNNSGNPVSDKVDVYSFGIVMWELLTGEKPFADLDDNHMIVGVVNNTLRPQVPASCDPEWKSLMERCWSSEPSERPSFAEIAKELCSIALKSSSKNYNRR